MRKIVFLPFFLTLSLSTPLFAEDPKVMPLIRQYVQAIRQGDVEGMNKAWQQLDQNPAALTFMQKFLPRLYLSYELKTMERRLFDLKERYANRLTVEPIVPPSTFQRGKATINNRPNQESLGNLANQKLPSNTDLVERLANQTRLSNDITVRRFPNQNRLSNRELIHNRRPR